MSTPPKDGRPAAAARRVTLADVARRAGVSQTAASFVLSGRREEMRISTDVETRVLQAARETGYRPNIVSRSLRTGTTHTIGFVSDTEATTPIAGDLIMGALAAARDRGYLLLIAETEGDGALEQELLEAMIDRQVDGIVFATMYTRKAVVPKLLRSRRAVLLHAVPSRPAPLVAGHREGIYLIGAGPRSGQGPAGSLAAVERLQGIKEALDEANVRPAGAVACADWQPELGYAAVKGLLDDGASIGALLCFNDRVAVGAYNALADAGLDVPSDVSVVSFDVDPIASWVRPLLTTIAIAHFELGRRSIELLLDVPSAKRDVGVIDRLPMPLRVRGSVAKPAQSHRACAR